MSSVPREAESEAKAEWRTQATCVRPGDRADARSHSTPLRWSPLGSRFAVGMAWHAVKSWACNHTTARVGGNVDFEAKMGLA
jgi:hypothetical protein